jgi:putative salt-induced outer membrane protein YdiY
MSSLRFGSIISALLFSQFAMADQIALKNGDRLTGAIVKSDEKTLTLKSEFAGVVTVPMDAIVQISSEQPLHVTTKDGQTLVGQVAADASKLEIKNADKGTVSVAKDSVVAVRSNAEQASWERMQHPKLMQLWAGNVDVGASFTQGNAHTSSFSVAMKAARATTSDKISLYATSLYARNTVTGTSVVTANAKRGGGRYDFNLSPRVFAFGFGDLESDDFQDLDLRVNGGGGLGWHAIKTERVTMDFFGGASVNNEHFATGLTRTSGDLVVGNETTLKLDHRTTFTEKTVYFPNMSELGEYRLAFDGTLAVALSNWLSWQLSASNRYLSNPLPGKKTNDIILTTGLRLTFAR